MAMNVVRGSSNESYNDGEATHRAPIHDSQRRGGGMNFSYPVARDSDIFLKNSHDGSTADRRSYGGYERTRDDKGRTWPTHGNMMDDDSSQPNHANSKTYTSSTLNRQRRRRPSQPEAMLPDYRLPAVHKSNNRSATPPDVPAMVQPVVRYQQSDRGIPRPQNTSFREKSETSLNDSDDSTTPPALVNSDIVSRQVNLPENKITKKAKSRGGILSGYYKPPPQPYRLPSMNRDSPTISDNPAVINERCESPIASPPAVQSSPPPKFDDEIKQDVQPSHYTRDKKTDVGAKTNPSRRKIRETRMNFEYNNDLNQTGNPWGDAYNAALATARARHLSRDLSAEFANRITRPYTFSYFSDQQHPSTCKCDNCLQNVLKDDDILVTAEKKRPSKLKKKHRPANGMKRIMGNVKIYDYFKFTPAKRRKSHGPVLDG